MKIWNRDETRLALPFDRLIPALREMFRQGCEAPVRHVHQLPSMNGQNTLLIMPAWQAGGLLGIKIVNIYPGNADRGLPALHSTYSLFDAATGEPLAMLDGDEITSRRTAAVSALAASYLAPQQSKCLLVVGSGRVASLLAEAYRAVLPMERVLVWSRNDINAKALASRLQAQAIDARAVTCLPSAVAQADVVCCATLATTPLVRRSDLRPTSHLDLIGGFTPAMREADSACFVGSRVYVDTREALAKSGDLLTPIAENVFCAADVAGDLQGLVRGEALGRVGGGRTVFKSVGSALEDLAAASLVYRGAAA